MIHVFGFPGEGVKGRALGNQCEENVGVKLMLGKLVSDEEAG